MNRNQRSSSCANLLFGALLLTCFGCSGGDGARVSGTATVNGTPLVGARVTARSSETGAWASGVTNDQGQFTLGSESHGEILPYGTYGVIIVEDRGDWDHPSPPKISAKYGDPKTSGISVVVDESGDKTLDLTLDPPQQRR